ILDEPTSGLDPLMQQVFFSELDRRVSDGATVFLSSHVLSEVARHCRRAAVIREGRVIACDSVENLSHTGAKKVVLRGVRQKPALPGLDRPIADDGNVSFLFSGSPRDLISALSGADFDDFCVTDPELDEVFMHFYKKEA
ncbi:MAG: ABC transporter ATP-binding protein, partial [Clostridia bacterium]|nr:ABC transporter ATP-binding protein [Clostridia bacterium]